MRHEQNNGSYELNDLGKLSYPIFNVINSQQTHNDKFRNCSL